MRITIPERIIEMTFAQYVGARIRRRRQELGMTMDDLIDVAPISKTFLSEVETGKRSIGYRKLYSLALALGRSTDWFAKGWQEWEE